MLKSFLTRAITGILFVVAIGVALYLSPMSYAMLMTCIITLATNEFCRMSRCSGQAPHFYIALTINLVGFMLGFLINTAGTDLRILLVMVGMIWLIFLVELFSHNEHPFLNIAMTLLCIVYVGMPFALFNLLAFKGEQYDYWPILYLFLLCWVNDTGAYLTGVTMGKHKLMERVSPKKTIEGFVGGIILTLAAAIAVHHFCSEWIDLPLWFCIVTALVASIIGTCGDLIESMFKRSVNIKDSGHMLPGHGGILDRFDAVMFVSPIVALLYYFFV